MKSSRPKFVSLRQQLDQQGYKQPFSPDSIHLVDKLFNELQHIKKTLPQPSPLTRNKAPPKGQKDIHFESDLHQTLRKREKEISDLRFLNNQYTQQLRNLEGELQKKNEKIVQLQENKKLARVHVNEKSQGYKSQQMAIDSLLPIPNVQEAQKRIPGIILSRDPLVADMLRIADNRIAALESQMEEKIFEVETLNKELESWRVRLEMKEHEIEGLNVRIAEGQRRLAVQDSVEKHKAVDRERAHKLQSELDNLRRTNADLEERLETAANEMKFTLDRLTSVQARNEVLESELKNINKTVQKLQADRKNALDAADQQLNRMKDELENSFHEKRGNFDLLKTENSRLRRCVEARETNSRRMEELVSLMLEDRHKLNDKINQLLARQHEMIVEMDSHNRHSTGGTGASKAQWENLVKNLQDQREFYKQQTEQLVKLARSSSS